MINEFDSEALDRFNLRSGPPNIGVPSQLVDLPGPSTGVLSFRVGTADEALYHRGLTHLVEHLALDGYRDPAVQFNGSVDLNRTQFWATGPKANVENFLTTVAERLSALPLDRLTAERGVMGAEARSRRSSLLDIHLQNRWGASGFGTTAWWEMAIPYADPDTVQAWSSRWFTSSNATLVLTNTPSDDFCLSLLPGEKNTAPVAQPIRQGRCYFRADTNTVSCSALVPRSHSHSTALALLQTALHEDLRHDGITYGVQAHWLRLDGDHALAYLSCDTAPAQERRLADAVAGAFERTALTATIERFDALQTARNHAEPESSIRAYLDSWSYDTLMGKEPEMFEEGLALGKAVDLNSVHRAIEDLRSELMVQIPHQVALTATAMPAIAAIPFKKIDGRNFDLSVGTRPHTKSDTITIGQQGIMKTTQAVGVATRRVSGFNWDEVVCTMKWNDGGRIVIGPSGDGIIVQPTRYVGGRALVDEVDRLSNPNRSVLVGPRFAAPLEPIGSKKSVSAVNGLLTMIAYLGWLLGLLFLPQIFISKHKIIWGLALIGLFTLTLTTHLALTKRRSPQVWDNSFEAAVPHDIDGSSAAIPGGLLLGWLAGRDLIEESVDRFSATDLAQFRNNVFTSAELYRRMGGVLADDMLTNEANEFLTDYMFQGTGGFDKDISDAFPSLTRYEIPDLTTSQRKVNESIDAAFDRWRKKRSSAFGRRFRRLRMFGVKLTPWMGPQSRRLATELANRIKQPIAKP